MNLSYLCFAGILVCAIANKSLGPFNVGNFVVDVSPDDLVIEVKSLGDNDKILFRTVGSNPFVRLGSAEVITPPIKDGNYQLEEITAYESDFQTIEDVTTSSQTLHINGNLMDKEKKFVGSYTMHFSPSDVSENQLSFGVSARRADESAVDRLFFSYFSEEEETFHGFGESFTGFNLKGRKVPILVSEQGVGRGLEPITDYLNHQNQGVGGTWYTTYAPKPLYMTNQNRSMVYSNSEIMIFDLTDMDVVEVELWSSVMAGSILSGRTMEELVSEVTLITGRMLSPPSWTQKGAVVGLEGGTTNVTDIVASLAAAGVPLAGIWLQDWVGLRHSWDGDRLIWNWEVNYDYYPGWNQMVDSWEANNTKVLTYINPFFSDPTNFTNQSRHNFFQEGVDNSYFVKKSDGSPYYMNSLSIEFCMLDLTNPDAVLWMKKMIKDQSMDEARASGWMADFGEYLPFDAVLFSGEDPAEYHNRYPEEWGKLTYEVLKENGKEDDIMYFMRSAWMNSPKYNSMFWLGDQLISWDEYDGLKNVIMGALAGGLSGHTITHSDIGGYTVQELGPAMNYLRSPELLKRWTELSTFGAGLFRTHIGSSMTSTNAQVYDDEASMAHFAEFANIFAAMAEYRSAMIVEAQETGLPLMRPMAMKYGYDKQTWGLVEQFLYGYDFLVAPCMTEGDVEVTLYFPQFSGPWVHLWSGEVFEGSSEGEWKTVSAPIGYPPVMFKQGSKYGEDIREYVISQGYVAGYEASSTH